MERAAALAMLDRWRAAQGAFYAGGPPEPLRALLHHDAEWHVPGRNAIAGDYHGVEDVMAYFARRRDMAAQTFRMHPGEVLVGDGEHVAAMTDGTARIDGREHRWSTLGLYRFSGGLLAAGWLLPLDPEAFDRIWAADDG
ncbi:MAG: hypothetical protein QOD81_2804 [Solirubrobacteraceae bacterium]|nr:hypothetical protein [Solirubrobacteraceae bacterium]